MAGDEMTGRVQRLVEQIRDWRAEDVRVDREERVVANIALTGLESRNGYRYSEAALREALPLYADKPVFLDHAVNAGRPYDRSTRDLVGAVVNPRFENGRVRGDVRVLDTEAGRTFLALAEGANPAVGMSQVVLAGADCGAAAGLAGDGAGGPGELLERAEARKVAEVESLAVKAIVPQPSAN